MSVFEFLSDTEAAELSLQQRNIKISTVAPTSPSVETALLTELTG